MGLLAGRFRRPSEYWLGKVEKVKKVEEWKSGRVEEWKSGRAEGWSEGGIRVIQQRKSARAGLPSALAAWLDNVGLKSDNVRLATGLGSNQREEK
jgi:hypothetical protein